MLLPQSIITYNDLQNFGGPPKTNSKVQMVPGIQGLPLNSIYQLKQKGTTENRIIYSGHGLKDNAIIVNTAALF